MAISVRKPINTIKINTKQLYNVGDLRNANHNKKKKAMNCYNKLITFFLYIRPIFGQKSKTYRNAAW